MIAATRKQAKASARLFNFYPRRSSHRINLDAVWRMKEDHRSFASFNRVSLQSLIPSQSFSWLGTACTPASGAILFLRSWNTRLQAQISNLLYRRREVVHFCHFVLSVSNVGKEQHTAFDGRMLGSAYSDRSVSFANVH